MSDGALVNHRKHFGFIKLFQEDYLWVSFVWCFRHRLELVWKDVVKEVLEPVDTSLCNLYFLYAKSSKNLEGQFKMCSAGPHLWKLPECIGLITTYVQWVALLKNLTYTHNICKMSFQRLPMLNTGRNLRGKHAKLVDARLLLCCALSIDVLAETKYFRLKKYHWCCWGCQKHTKKLLAIAEMRGERPRIDSQITHTKTHNWSCWSKQRWWTSLPVCEIKIFFCEKYIFDYVVDIVHGGMFQ